jgi:predicted permease
MFHWQDLRYALRLLARTPLFTLLTVAVLGGGLGLSIFTFSFLHTAILKPIPVADGDRVVRVLGTVDGATANSLDAADVAAMRPAITTLRDFGIYVDRELVAGRGDGARTIDATAAEWNIFQVTRTPPLVGRGFTPEDQLPGAEPVVVLSEATWRAAFGSDSTLVGRTIPLDGVATRVVGVMPRGYGFPVAAEAWVPVPPGFLTEAQPEQALVMAYARLAPGRSAAEADAELTGLLRRVQAERPRPAGAGAGRPGVRVLSFPMAQIGDEAPLVLAVLNLLATLILLLACVNVTNLLLARANERARETAVRLALGAPRGRLIMQSMWESVVLCLLGGAVATGLAVWLLDQVNAWARTRLEGNLAFWWVWGFDRSVLVGAGVFVTLAMIVLGVVVSRRAVNTEIGAVLADGAARTGSQREGRAARALVVLQVSAVSLLMFFGAVSAIIAWRVVHVDLGYDTRNLLSAAVAPPTDGYPDPAKRAMLYQTMHDRLADRGEVESVLLRAGLGQITDASGEFEPDRTPAGTSRPRAWVQGMLGSLTTLGIGVEEGRGFDSRDAARGEPVAIVSRAMAERYWPGTSPIGRQITLPGLGEAGRPRTIVGVVKDLLLGNPLGRDRSPLAVYLPLEQHDAEWASVIFRYRGSEAAARAAFHEAAVAVDSRVVPGTVSSYQEILEKSTAIARSVSTLFGGAFGFALLLAVSGTYGLMARAIGRRTREIGVRRALGATDWTILAMLMGQGARQLGIGALFALPFTLLAGLGFAHFFPISAALALSTAVLVALAVSGIVLLATLVPTRRAVGIEPRDALWRE